MNIYSSAIAQIEYERLVSGHLPITNMLLMLIGLDRPPLGYVYNTNTQTWTYGRSGRC